MTVRSIEEIPEWSLNYVINGDATGLYDEEIDIIDKWLNENKAIVVDIVYDENGSFESYFSHFPAFGKSASVVDCIVEYGF